MILEEHPRGGGKKHALVEGEKTGFRNRRQCNNNLEICSKIHVKCRKIKWQ